MSDELERCDGGYECKNLQRLNTELEETRAVGRALSGSNEGLIAEIDKLRAELASERRWRQALDKSMPRITRERDVLLTNNASLREQLARAERRINSLKEALADL